MPLRLFEDPKYHLTELKMRYANLAVKQFLGTTGYCLRIS